MIKKVVKQQIHQTIQEIWEKNIPKDFNAGYIVNEDCLKMSLCYHLRRKLSTILIENNLRIYTEKYFPAIKKKPDIIIVEIRDNYPENSLYDSIREEDVIVLFELKFRSDAAHTTEAWMKQDVWKLKDYVKKSKIQSNLYFAVIYEVECSWLNWLDNRSTNNWAKGRITELNAGWINGKMQYEVHTY